jgi:hypothetical protein
MDMPSPRPFKRVGTPEFILAEANLVKVNEGRNADTIEPGEELVKLFPADKPMPPIEKLIPGLTAMVQAKAYDAVPYLAGNSARLDALRSLNAEGLTHEIIATIGEKFSAATKATIPLLKAAMRMVC